MSQLLQSTATAHDARNEVWELWKSGRISDSDVQADEELKTIYRALAKKSLYFWVKGVLGYPDLTEHTHLELCNFVQDLRNPRTLVLLPRGCFKTTVGTIGLASWILMHDSNQRILLANQIEENVETMLLEIQQHFEGDCAMINWLFPEMVKPNAKFGPWNRRRMTFPHRTMRSGTPSITALGVGARAESKHFDIILNDDLIGAKAMASTIEMTDALIWHDYSVSLFVNASTGIERCYGTRWSLSDIYSVLLENPKYKHFIRPAENFETGELFFPERLSREVLNDIRDTNYALYMSQYMNDPDNPEVLEFRKSWLKYFNLVSKDNKDNVAEPHVEADGTVEPVSAMDAIIVIDPAGSGDVDEIVARQARAGRARKSDNAIEVWAQDGLGRFFLLDMWAGRGRGTTPEKEIAEKMYEFSLRWRGYVRRLYVEAYGAQAALLTIFKMVCKTNGVTFPTEEIPRGIKKAKNVRIRTGIGAPAENGQIYVRRIHSKFIYQFSKYGSIDKVDCVDAAAWGVLLLRRPPSPVDKRAKSEKLNKRRAQKVRMVGRGGY